MPELIEKGEMLLVGVVSDIPGGGDIHTLWQRFEAGAKAIQNTVEGRGYELQIYPEGHKAGEPFVCMAAVEVTALAPLPPDMFAKLLPPCRYAVFTHHCSEGYDGVNQEIDRWLETSDYRAAANYALQVYDDRFRGMTDPTSEIDIMVPITPRP